MIAPSVYLWNDLGPPNGGLSTILKSGLAGLGAVDRVLCAIRHGVDVASGAANGIACSHGKGADNQSSGQYFLKHACFSSQYGKW
jgi:hypothetical protein